MSLSSLGPPRARTDPAFLRRRKQSARSLGSTSRPGSRRRGSRTWAETYKTSWRKCTRGWRFYRSRRFLQWFKISTKLFPKDLKLTIILPDWKRMRELKFVIWQKGKIGNLKLFRISLNFCLRYLMVCCHKQLFCPFSTTDEEKDLEIQEKIRWAE